MSAVKEEYVIRMLADSLQGLHFRMLCSLVGSLDWLEAGSRVQLAGKAWQVDSLNYADGRILLKPVEHTPPLTDMGALLNAAGQPGVSAWAKRFLNERESCSETPPNPA